MDCTKSFRTDSIPIRWSVVIHNSLGDLKLLVKINSGFMDLMKSVNQQKNLLTLLFGALQLGGQFFQSSQ